MKEGEWPGEVVEGVGQWTGPQRARPGPHQGMVHYSFYSSLKYIHNCMHMYVSITAHQKEVMLPQEEASRGEPLHCSVPQPCYY